MHDLVNNCSTSISKWKINKEQFRHILLFYFQRGEKKIIQVIKIIVKLPKNYLIFVVKKSKLVCQIVLGTFFLPKLTESWQKVIEQNGRLPDQYI